MIDFYDVTDTPVQFGRQLPLLTAVNIHIPPGRHGLVSATPEFTPPLLDLLAGVRPPDQGRIEHSGRVSWVIGRGGFVRGHTTGKDLIQLLASVYTFDFDIAVDVVTNLVSQPDYLDTSVSLWPGFARRELTFALALVPEFDLYLIDAQLPFGPNRFARLWQALFEERLAGKSLILSCSRPSQMLDHCATALVHEQQGLRLDNDIDTCVARYPARTSNEDFGKGDAESDAGETELEYGAD